MRSPSFTWPHWLTDNPFLTWDLRRRLRKGYVWKAALGGVVLPVLILLLTQALMVWGPEWIRHPLARREGLFLFVVLGWAHLGLTALMSGGSMTLIAEAAADRLDFLRMTPRGRRELMVLIGVARAAFRLVPLILPLPLYALLLGYGKLQWQDVLGLYGLLALFLFAPPSVLEITSAFGAKRGSEATTGKTAGTQATAASGNTAATASGLSTGLAWPVMIQVVIHLVIRPVLVPLIKMFGQGWTAAIGPDLRQWMPLSLMAAVARVVGTPQTFFHTHLTPLWPLLLSWSLVLMVRVLVGGELWSREARTTADGVALPPETGRPEERRLADRIAGTNTLFAALMVSGFFWPAIERGGLGRLIGVMTPEASLLGLFLLFGVGYGIYAWERAARNGAVGMLGSTPAWKQEAAEWGRGLLMGAAVMATAGLLGGILPGLRALELLARLAVMGLVAVTFGTAWQAFLRRALPEGTLERDPTQAAIKVGGSLLWIAVYAAPLAALSKGGSNLVWHYLAGWSPVYGLLALVSGVWQSRAPLPIVAQVGMPLVVALLLWKFAPRPRIRPLEVRSRQPDWLERLVERRTAAMDNPFITLTLSRAARKPTGMGRQVAYAIGGYLSLGLVLAVAISSGITARSGLSVLDALLQPTPIFGMKLAAVITLAGAGVGLLMLLQFWPAAMSTQILGEHTRARAQGRIPFLYMTSLPEEGAVRGLMATAILSGAPVLAGVAVTSLVCLVAALALGAHPAWVLFWLLGVVATLLQGLHQGLRAFDHWRLERPFRERFWSGLLQMVAFLGWVALIPAMFIMSMLWQVPTEQLVAGYAALQLAATVYAAVRLSATFQGAIRAMRLSRSEADLERVS